MSGPLAFVDESQSDSRRDPNVYILAAVICDPSVADELREAMRALRLRGQDKVHWRDESDPRRMAIVRAIVASQMASLVVVRAGTVGERPERRRRLTMERLLHELTDIGVQNVTLESRGRVDDQRDRALLDQLRARRVITGGLRMDHCRGRDDALLWAADAACGVVSQARTGNIQYLTALEHRITLHAID